MRGKNKAYAWKRQRVKRGQRSFASVRSVAISCALSGGCVRTAAVKNTMVVQ
ncbi:hypothetical protein EXIGLDRAFT_720891 [Exidia glandulosa HHB12029]|uniref:Uncharacterized protein n=1 Tax=Exidia glandulosa HHB12029 TaxID=1314781 RepID=A0A165NFC0_EXIGL|nr:hypothetical protein EXIGLDRAFT_720891 [Exidia glandulosa HHB12029]